MLKLAKLLVRQSARKLRHVDLLVLALCYAIDFDRGGGDLALVTGVALVGNYGKVSLGVESLNSAVGCGVLFRLGKFVAGWQR